MASKRRPLTRCVSTLCLAFIASSLVSNAPSAQDWPQKPLKLIVGTAPGGLVDIMGRIVAQHLADEINQSVVVENRPGAGGNIAAKAVASAPADGHTLLLTGNNHAVNAILLPNPGFSYDSDFAPVAMIAQSNMIIAASPTLRADNIAQLIALAKGSPGSISMAISPIGTPNHLGAELLMHMADVDLTIVPYPGISAAIPDLTTNRVQLALGSIPSIMSYVQDKRLKALAVTRMSRSPFAPEIPTADESGLSGYDVNAWTCMMAPRTTPPAILEKLNRVMQAVLALPEVRQVLGKQGVEVATMAPAELATFLSTETIKWASVLKKARIK